jgi:DNA-binding response OmpR family regulator
MQVNGNNRNVLVIDDEPVMRDVVKAVLEEDGYDVHVADNGVAGLVTFNDHPCELVITDLVMPGKGGTETCQTLLSMNPQVRIIAISGAAHAASNFPVLKHLGVRVTLHKPFGVQELRAAVAAAFADTP